MAAESFSGTAIILKTLIAAREETLELQRLENNPLGHQSFLCTATSPLRYNRAAEEDYGPTSQMAVIRKP